MTPYLTTTSSSAAPITARAAAEQLAEWGISRGERSTEPEDHISSVCEVIRFAIAVQHARWRSRKRSFDRFVYEGGVAFCDGSIASAKADFYRVVLHSQRIFPARAQRFRHWREFALRTTLTFVFPDKNYFRLVCFSLLIMSKTRVT